MLIGTRPAEHWRSDCQACLEEDPPGLKYITIYRQVDTASSYGLAVCLCSKCRQELLTVLLDGLEEDLHEKKE